MVFLPVDDKPNKMTIVLDVSFDDNQQNNGDSQNEISRKKVKHNACSSKVIKVAKVKNKVSKKVKKVTEFSISFNAIIKFAIESRNSYYSRYPTKLMIFISLKSSSTS